MRQRAGDVLRAYKEQHGLEQHYGFLKDPLIVNSLLLKKPERIEALGLVLWLALLLWRLRENTAGPCGDHRGDVGGVG
jgi:transposase